MGICCQVNWLSRSLMGRGGQGRASGGWSFQCSKRPWRQASMPAMMCAGSSYVIDWVWMNENDCMVKTASSTKGTALRGRKLRRRSRIDFDEEGLFTLRLHHIGGRALDSTRSDQLGLGTGAAAVSTLGFRR